MRPLLWFLLTAGVTTLVLGRVLPPVGEPFTDEKLAAFAERRDEFDVLLLGSSQTFRGVDPVLFDARTAEAGVETRTFNLGIPGAALAEYHGVLERVAELEPARLRWVLIEAENVVRVGGEGPFLTRKNIALHDLETAALLWPHYAEVEPRARRMWRARWKSLVALAYNAGLVGRGVPWIQDAIGMGTTAAEHADWLGPLENGYVNPEDSVGEGMESRRRDFLARPQFYERLMLRMRDRRPSPGRADPTARPFYERIEEVVRSMGASPVFFTIRRGAGRSDARALARDGAIEALLHFDDARRYPELYDVALTYDGSHFDRTGAKVFSEYLADAFVALVKSRAP